jgi:hypothetical protein
MHFNLAQSKHLREQPPVVGVPFVVTPFRSSIIRKNEEF